MQVELNSYQDIGDYLRDLRESQHYDVRDIGYHLNIRTKYLIAIEAGDMNAMPGKVYARGYLQHYCEFLGGDKMAVAAAFDRVESGKVNVRFFLPEPRSKHYQPGLIFVALILLGVGSIYYYWYETHKSIIVPPEIAGVAPLPERLIDPTRKIVGIPQNDDAYVPISLPEEPQDRPILSEVEPAAGDPQHLPVVDPNAVAVAPAPDGSMPTPAVTEQRQIPAENPVIAPVAPQTPAAAVKKRIVSPAIPTRAPTHHYQNQNYQNQNRRVPTENPQQKELESLPWLREPRIKR